VPGSHVTALGMAAASLAVVPFCFPAMAPAVRDPPRLITALLVAIVSRLLPYSLEMAAMRRMSIRSLGILMSLDPALAALFRLVLLASNCCLRWLAVAASCLRPPAACWPGK
jgi:inner membrane transporter RhtA